jgi:hypothetical protein
LHSHQTTGQALYPGLPFKERNNMQDLKTLDQEQLEQLRIDVLNEIERRSNLDSIPQQVKQLATTYVDGGGSRDDLVAAVNDESRASGSEEDHE